MVVLGQLYKNKSIQPAIPAHLYDLASKASQSDVFRKPLAARTAAESAMNGFMRVCERRRTERSCLHGAFQAGVVVIQPQ